MASTVDPRPPASEFEHDIAISFASEDVDLASRLADRLEKAGVSVFFSTARQAALLGARLERVLTRTFGSGTRFVAVLVTEHYPIKEWTRFELAVAREEEARRDEPFVLPLLLADASVVQLPSDKVHLDLRTRSLDDIVEILAAKVRDHRGEQSPQDLLKAVYREWIADRHLPAPTKVDVLWKNVTALDLDVDHCELLLRSSSTDGAAFVRGLRSLGPSLLAPAAERLVATAESPNLELAAICYLGVADPERAEGHLWRIYQDASADLEDRARAFELFWLCPGQRSRDEARVVLCDEAQPFALRRAAMVNVLWAKRSEDTERLVRQGLHDPRQEVRAKAVDAVLRFRLGSLAPELMAAYRRTRSRKGKAQLKAALRHFNGRTDIRAFAEKLRFGKTFFEPPSYVHDWEESRPDWV